MMVGKYIFDSLSALAALFVCFVLFTQPGSLLFDPSGLHTLPIITSLESTIASALASISGMLIAAYLISSQLAGHRPYSRLVASFHGPSDWYPFAFLLLTVASSIGILALTPRLIPNHLYIADASVALLIGALSALASLMLKHFAIFNPRAIADMALRLFTARRVRDYGLLDVATNRNNSIESYRIRSWGHRHNLVDPLGPFHDILMEAIQEKQRITLHLYLSSLIKRIAHLNGVPFQRSFALAKSDDPPTRNTVCARLKLAWFAMYRRNLGTSLQLTAHALHYLVRRAKKMIDEWELDNHRQIFLINLADLALCLAKRRDSGVLIDLCMDGIVRISLDYRNVPPYGSYEPLHELFQVVVRLRQAGLHGSANRCAQALAFLDLETPYITQSSLSPWSVTAENLPSEVVTYFNSQREMLRGKSLGEAFPRNLWPD